MTELVIKTPLGPMLAVEEDGFLTALDFIREADAELREGTSPLLLKTREEIVQYFNGERKVFTIPMKPKGTAFQKMVWDALLKIPYAQTRSYKDIALFINHPKAFRAVGGANHNNPSSIIIPCHRVIGSSGKLTGYGGGLDRKKALLDLEQVL